MLIFKNLCPNLFVDKVQQINLVDLRAQGYDTMLIDLDNTLVSWRGRSINPEVALWLREAAEYGFKLCIVSNCIIGKRVHHFEELLGIPTVSKAVKPRRRKLLEAIRMLNGRPETTVVIGDQVFTDIWGGNRIGAFTILVTPVDRREYMTTVLQRAAEKILLFRFRRRGMLKEQK